MNSYDSHAKISDDNVRRWILGAVQDVFWSAKDAPRSITLTGEKKGRGVLEISVHDVVVVQVLHTGQY
jgi:hypothetical protein